MTIFFCTYTFAGPYTEMGINGYIGEDYRHADPLEDVDAVLNPIFRGWADSVHGYIPSDDEWSGDWNDPNKALGPVTGENFDIVSLGDLDATELAASVPPGQITLIFGDPCNPADPNHIKNLKGYDFAVFENGFISTFNTSGGSVFGEMFAELAYVEVSTNGIDFARFPSVSLTDGPVGAYGTVEISNIYNLAGKHPNAYGTCVGTPFDLDELMNEPNVMSGIVDINNIIYVRIVDIAGRGDFYDSATKHTDADTWPNWDYYLLDNPIYDAWLTWGSGGHDLEAVGVLREQEYSADINLDGIVDNFDFAILASAWMTHFGQDGWVGRCDLAEPEDLFIDYEDLELFISQWQQVEQWRE